MIIESKVKKYISLAIVIVLAIITIAVSVAIAKGAVRVSYDSVDMLNGFQEETKDSFNNFEYVDVGGLVGIRGTIDVSLIDAPVDEESVSLAEVFVRGVIGLLYDSPFGPKLQGSSYLIVDTDRGLKMDLSIGGDVLSMECLYYNGLPYKYTLNREFTDDEALFFLLLDSTEEVDNGDGTFTFEYQ